MQEKISSTFLSLNNLMFLQMVKVTLYRSWRPLVDAPTFSDIRLAHGGEVVSPTRRPLFTPGRLLVLISVRCSVLTKQQISKDWKETL
jgi:hypothetical protein